MISREQELDRMFAQGHMAAIIGLPMTVNPYVDIQDSFIWQMGYQYGIAELWTWAEVQVEGEPGAPAATAAARPVLPNLVIF